MLALRDIKASSVNLQKIANSILYEIHVSESFITSMLAPFVGFVAIHDRCPSIARNVSQPVVLHHSDPQIRH